MSTHKAKQTKAKNNYRKTEFLCPECMSTLKVNKNYEKECSGDRLKLWINRFKDYKKLNKQSRVTFLEAISDKGKFLDLYNQWKDSGKLICDYTNKLYDILPNDYVLVPDPMMLKRIERDLGELNKDKLNEDTVFYFDGTKYHKRKAKGRKEVKLEWLKFPGECE